MSKQLQRVVVFVWIALALPGCGAFDCFGSPRAALGGVGAAAGAYAITKGLVGGDKENVIAAGVGVLAMFWACQEIYEYELRQASIAEQQAAVARAKEFKEGIDEEYAEKEPTAQKSASEKIAEENVYYAVPVTPPPHPVQDTSDPAPPSDGRVGVILVHPDGSGPIDDNVYELEGEPAAGEVFSVAGNDALYTSYYGD